jgi:hypothetical protein
MVDFWYRDVSYYLAEEVDSDTQYATLTLKHIATWKISSPVTEECS